MAKKRKNDTRIDPFATQLETSNLDILLENAAVGDEITMPAPSDPNRTIKLSCKVIPHNQIETHTQVYDKNRRVQSLLTETSVSDLLPAIKADGRNLHPALCWKIGDIDYVLAGSRRRKACSLTNSDYIVLTSADFNAEDAKILAITSDQYIAPSLWELGQAYAQTRSELINEGKKGSYREIAEIEGVSHTAIADAIKAYDKLPANILSLYPTANHVGREVAKKLITALENEPDKFNERLKETQANLAALKRDSDDKTAQAITKSLIESSVQSKNKENVDFKNNYINAHRSMKTGDMVIKIDNKVLTEKRFEQLSKLLVNFN